MTNKNENRTLENLVKKKGEVWLYLESEELTSTFLQQAMDEDFRWSNGKKIEITDGGYLFGVHTDKTIARLSMYIWCISFQCHGKIPGTKPRIDYEKYVNGDEDYFCHEPHISGYFELGGDKITMTYGEYEKQALESLESHSDFSKEYIDEIIKRECIRVSYEKACAATKFLGSDQLSPSGFAYGCSMLYPDFPDSYEEYLAAKEKEKF